MGARNILTTVQIDSVPEGAVVFVSCPKIPNACYGGLMTLRAKYQGAVGSVIDGRFRDLQEQREQQWPVGVPRGIRAHYVEELTQDDSCSPVTSALLPPPSWQRSQAPTCPSSSSPKTRT